MDVLKFHLLRLLMFHISFHGINFAPVRSLQPLEVFEVS